MGQTALSDPKNDRREGEKRPGAAPPAERDVGQALRSIYSSTVGEDIPSDLLDLLGKLN